jgi:hypothetical protein
VYLVKRVPSSFQTIVVHSAKPSAVGATVADIRATLLQEYGPAPIELNLEAVANARKLGNGAVVPQWSII